MKTAPAPAMARAKRAFLGKESVPGVDRVGATPAEDVDDGVCVEVALGRGGAGEAVSLVSHTDM